MKITVSGRLIWYFDIDVEATDHADAAQQIRDMGNAEIYDGTHQEITEIYDTTEVTNEKQS